MRERAEAREAVRPCGSSRALPRLARTEKAEQRLDDTAFGAHRHFVDREAAHQMLSRLALLVHVPVECGSHLRIAGVDIDRLARFRIDEARKSDVRKLELAGVL